MDRMRQISSMLLRTHGNRSLTSVPHADSRLNSHKGARYGFPFLAFFCSFDAAIRPGFGSNVSMWETPPLQLMKMTRFARGGKCGVLGARSSEDSARHCCRMAGNRAEPATIERIICRRVGSKLEYFEAMGVPSVHKEKFVARKQHAQETRQSRAGLPLGG